MKKLFLAILLLLGLVYLTPRLLIRLSLFLGNFSQPTAEKEQVESFLFPPVLEPLPEATNSSRLTIKGFSQGAKNVEIFINNISKKKVPVSGEGAFETKVSLYEGENKIKAVALTNQGKKSNPSKEIIVVYKKRGPKLSIENPEDEEHFSSEEKKIKITGKTDPGSFLKINDRWVVVKNDGSFSFEVELSPGENLFKIIAQDAAGNKTTITRRVTYSQD